MEATQTGSLIKQIQEMITADDLRLFLMTCGMALAGAIVNATINKAENLRDSLKLFFSSMIFGIMAGSATLIIYKKVAFIIAGVFSLFSKPIYAGLEKVLPKTISNKAKQILK